MLGGTWTSHPTALRFPFPCGNLGTSAGVLVAEIEALVPFKANSVWSRRTGPRWCFLHEHRSQTQGPWPQLCSVIGWVCLFPRRLPINKECFTTLSSLNVMGAREMAQWGKALVAEPDNPVPISELTRWKERTNPASCPWTSTCLPQTHTNEYM